MVHSVSIEPLVHEVSVMSVVPVVPIWLVIYVPTVSV